MTGVCVRCVQKLQSLESNMAEELQDREEIKEQLEKLHNERNCLLNNYGLPNPTPSPRSVDFLLCLQQEESARVACAFVVGGVCLHEFTRWELAEMHGSCLKCFVCAYRELWQVGG